jgi:hypothetical protein
MLVPVSIVRSGLILEVTGDKSLVSTTFIAKFSDGTEKMLNKKAWILTELLKGEEAEKEPVNVTLSKDYCNLYYRDWSNVPVLGSFDTDYPQTVIPLEKITYSELLRCSHERLCGLMGISVERIQKGYFEVSRDTMVDELISSNRVIFNK